MIAGAGNVVIFNRICSWRVRKVASVARRVAVCVFWVGSWSNGLGSVAHWKWRFSCFQQISVRCWVVILRGRRSLWWGWRVLTVAPPILNDVSYVSTINHEIDFARQAQHLVKFMCHFSWQVQHLVKFMCHFSWQAQHLVKFMCHFSWQAQHVVKFGMIAGAGNVVIFNRICSWRVRKVASVARRVAVCVFWVGSWSNGLGSVAHWKWRFSCFQQISVWSWVRIMRGRRSLWWGWRVTVAALRIGNDVSYVSTINHDIHFAWQAQYLVRCEGDACCSAHCKWRFIREQDQSWHSFCVAGAVFGEVAGCSAHWKWRFICDADQSWSTL